MLAIIKVHWAGLNSLGGAIPITTAGALTGIPSAEISAVVGHQPLVLALFGLGMAVLLLRIGHPWRCSPTSW